MAQDFYELLGVARDADANTIKRAYRKKARELHPDVSDAPDAEEQFRRVTGAYEVLSDEQQRATYDRYGEEGLRTGGWEPQYANFGSIADIFGAFFGDDAFGAMGGARGSQARGEDVRLGVELDLRDAVLGTERDLTFTAPTTCEQCSGSGAKTPEAVTTCTTCQGVGVIRQVARSIFGQVVQERECPSCEGRGTTITEPCDACHGSGDVPQQRTVTVAIPAGINDGQRIRLTGRGGAGPHGAPPGSLYVDVRVQEDERFLREGDDLITVLDLTMTEASLGVVAMIPTVDGEDHELEIPAGTQPGTRMTLSRLGAGRLHSQQRSRSGELDRGDLIVFCNVRVPTNLSSEQRDVLERFHSVETDQNYDEREGILTKLRRMVRP